MMRKLKSSPTELSLEDIERASAMWCQGSKRAHILNAMGWEQNLFDRVVRLCRECVGAPPFPPRRTHHIPQGYVTNTAHNISTKSKAWSDMTPKEQRAYLQAKGEKIEGPKPRTIRSIRPVDLYHARQGTAPAVEGQLA